MSKYLKFIIAGAVIFFIVVKFTGKTVSHSEAHKVALSFIENSPDLTEALGHMASVTLSPNDGTYIEQTQAKLIFKVHGDVDSGKVHVSLVKASGKWQVSAASFDTSSHKTVSLLK